MSLDVKIDIRPHIDRLWFDKRELKLAIRTGGKLVQKEARRLIARRAISGTGELPGYDSGAMSRAVKVKVGSGGGYAKVQPQKTSEMGKYFYPAYLVYGTSRGLKKRKDFIQTALGNKQGAIRRAFVRSLIGSIRVNSH